MKRFAFLLMLCWGAALGAGKPVIRAELEMKKPALAGQQIRLNVTILVPNFFGGAPRWPAIDLPGAVVTQDEGSSINVNDQIGGETYAGIRRTYLIVAQQGGDYQLPALKIPFKYAAVPGKPPVDGEVTLPSLKFSVKGAPGAAAGAPSTPVAKVTIQQTVERSGDALMRTVDIYAEHTQAMMIPPPAFDAPPGVRVYRKDPVLTDESKDRIGFLGGRRVDRATYVFEKAGDYVLPAIEIGWFNPATQKQEKAIAPEIKVAIAPGDLGKTGIAPDAPAQWEPAVAQESSWDRVKAWLPLGGTLALAALIAAWLVRRASPRFAAALAVRRERREESEPAFAVRVERAADAAAVYRAYLAWLRRTSSAPDAGLQSELRKLESALFSAHAAPCDTRAFVAAFRNFRKNRAAERTERVSNALPLLNP